MLVMNRSHHPWIPVRKMPALCLGPLSMTGPIPAPFSQIAVVYNLIRRLTLRSSLVREKYLESTRKCKQ
jgi:hypothetical protein